jgi:hypothetical protein
MYNRCNTNSLLRNYNKKLLRRSNYDRFIVRYKENSKSINILRYKRKNKKFIQLFFNKNDVRFLSAKEALILF